MTIFEKIASRLIHGDDKQPVAIYNGSSIFEGDSINLFGKGVAFKGKDFELILKDGFVMKVTFHRKER